MFKESIDIFHSSYRISFGKYKGMHIEDIPVDWIAWWLNKREKDEKHGPDIEWDHKVSAERIYNFDRTYLLLIYTLSKNHGIRHTIHYTKYKTVTENFWKAIDNDQNFVNDNNKHFVKDEIEAFMWHCWKEYSLQAEN